MMDKKEYREMARDFIGWKKLHPKGFMSRWDYFVKQWLKKKEIKEKEKNG